MLNKFAKWLVPKLEQRCIDKGDVLTISGTDDPENVYLIRYFLFRSKYLSIFIHRFLRSDKDDFHDHPFNFLGYVVSKGYKEVILHGRKMNDKTISGYFSESSFREEGTFAYRKSTTIHKVYTDRSYLPEEYKEAPLTVIFRGSYSREWGFWKKLSGTHYIWEYWRDYLGVPESDIRE